MTCGLNSKPAMQRLLEVVFCFLRSSSDLILHRMSYHQIPRVISVDSIDLTKIPVCLYGLRLYTEISAFVVIHGYQLASENETQCLGGRILDPFCSNPWIPACF